MKTYINDMFEIIPVSGDMISFENESKNKRFKVI